MSSQSNQDKQEVKDLDIDVPVDSKEDSSVSVIEKNPAKKFRLMAVFISILAIAGIGFFFFKPQEKLAQEENTTNIDNTPAKLSVKTVTADFQPIQSWVFSDGYVSALIKKHLTFQAEGTINYLKQVNGRDLKEGDYVAKGDLLARVDRRKYQSDITVAQAQQTEAQNQVISAITDVKKAEQALVQAKADKQSQQESLVQAKTELEKAKTETAFVKAQMERYQLLYSEGVVEKQKVEEEEKAYKNAQQNEITAKAKVNSALAQIKVAEANIRSQQAQLIATQAKLESAQAGVKSAIAQVDKANVEIEDTDLIAPFSGVITRLNIRQGEYWTPNIVSVGGDYQTITDRLPIIMIDPTKFEVNVELPAFRGGQVKPGQTALIILERDRSKATSGKITGQDLINLASARGTVFSVSPSVSPGERSVRVTIRVNQGQLNIQDGERVSAWIAVEEKNNAIVAPFNAFIFRDRNPYIFVVNEENGTVEQRAITQGIEGLSKREIITGVEVGEKLVTEGKNRLVNGTPVEIISE